MDAEPGSPPGAEPTNNGRRNPAGPGQGGSIPSKNTTRQQLVALGAILVALIAVVSGILGIFGPFSAGRDHRHGLLQFAAVMAFLTAAACIVLLVRARQMSVAVYILASSLIVSSGSAVWLLRSHATANGATPKATIHFSNPHFDAQDPLKVRCNANIQITGSVPKGYVFAVGNVITGRDIGDSLPVFYPESSQYQIKPGVWNVPQYFGGSSDTGKSFAVYLVVMPTSEQTYLSNEAQQVRAALATTMRKALPRTLARMGRYITVPKGQQWWIAPGLPPLPSRKLAVEYAQRVARC